MKAVPPHGAQRGVTSLFAGRGFLLLWLGQTISWIGDSFYFIALLWLVIDLTGSRSLLGVVAAARTLPSLLGFASGALVDRWDRRRIMILSDISRAALVGLVPLLQWAGLLQPWHLPVIAFALGLLSIFFVPARQSLLPELVRQEQLVAANAWMSASQQLSGAAGFAFGGVLAGLAGIRALLLVDAASFAISAALLATMRPTARAAGTIPSPPGGLFGSVREGLVFIRSDVALSRVLPLILAMNFVIVPVFVLIPSWVSDVLGSGARTFGFMEAAQMLGMVAGALVVSPLTRRLPRSNLILHALLAQGLFLLAFSSTRSVPLALGEMFGFGLTDALAVVAFTAYLQAAVPVHLRGRVFGTVDTFSQALVPLGQALGGAIGALVPLPTLFASIAGLRIAGLALLAGQKQAREALDLGLTNTSRHRAGDEPSTGTHSAPIGNRGQSP